MLVLEVDEEVVRANEGGVSVTLFGVAEAGDVPRELVLDADVSFMVPLEVLPLLVLAQVLLLFEETFELLVLLIELISLLLSNLLLLEVLEGCVVLLEAFVLLKLFMLLELLFELL